MGPDPRGRYDRHLTPAERAHGQRVRLLEACASALDRHGPIELTVSRILERVAIGRNTFYAHFTDVPNAILALRVHALAHLLAAVDAELIACRTPHSRVRALAVGWIEAAAARPSFARAVLMTTSAFDVGPHPTVAALCQRLCEIWALALRDGATGRPVDTDRAWHVAAALAFAGTGVEGLSPEKRRRASSALVSLAEQALR